MTTVTKEFNAKHGVLAGTSSTNHLKFSGSTTGNPVTICAQGYDEDISIYLYPKGNGTVNFPSNVTASVSLTNDNSTDSTFYPTFSATSSGIVVGLTASSSKFSFNPSNGMLCSTLFNGICVGNGAGINSCQVNNLAFGYQTLQSNTTGIYNTAIGAGALSSNTTGSRNDAQGNGALLSNTTGNKNVAIGSGSLRANTYGSNNTAQGYRSLYSNTYGCNNVATGYQSLYSNTTGCGNTAQGYKALTSNTTSNYNAANGYQALYCNTGSRNSAHGASALRCNTTGNFNVAFGNLASYCNTTGSNSVAIGACALYSYNSTGGNIAIGFGAATATTTGEYNVAIGYQTFYTNIDGGCNTAVGTLSLNKNTAGSYNSAIGTYSMYCNTSGTSNTAIGYWSLNQNSIGSCNVALGYQSLRWNTCSSGNTATGSYSMYCNTTGERNVAIGSYSLFSNLTGYNNTATGFRSLYYTTGDNNTANGYGSLYNNTTGISNTAVGAIALYCNTFGNNNTALGNQSLRYNTQGNANTAIGDNSLSNNTTGTYNTAVGVYALCSNTTGTNNVGIGKQSGSSITTGIGNVIIGSNAGSAGLMCCIILSDGAGTNKFNITCSGSVCIPTSVTATNTTSGSLIVAGGVGIGENLHVGGNLTINGTTTTINSTVTTIDDPVFTLGGDTVPVADDNKDRGIEFRYHTGSAAKVGFFGFDDSTGKFTFIPDATNTSEVFSGTKGYIDAYVEWADIQNAPSTASIIITDDTTTNADYYPTFATTTGTVTSLKVDTTELTFNPGTNLFTVPSLKVSNSLYDSTNSAGLNGYVLSVSPTGTVVWAPPAASGWVVKTANYTAVTGNQIIADTSAGSFTITLPATPTAGDTVKVADNSDWSVNNLIIARNGSTIEDEASNLTIDVGALIVDFIYDGATWQVFATYASLGNDNTLTAEDDTTTALLYPVMVSTDGVSTTPKVTKSKFSFNASTGELTATDFNSASDINLKTEVNTLTDSIEILKKINPVSFKWKGSGKQSYGVIAQELEKILPELTEEENKVKSVKYIPLIALLINAIVELNNKIENK